LLDRQVLQDDDRAVAQREGKSVIALRNVLRTPGTSISALNLDFKSGSHSPAFGR
jgi:hypothetical protein